MRKLTIEQRRVLQSIADQLKGKNMSRRNTTTEVPVTVAEPNVGEIRSGESFIERLNAEQEKARAETAKPRPEPTMTERLEAAQTELLEKPIRRRRPEMSAATRIDNILADLSPELAARALALVNAWYPPENGVKQVMEDSRR